MLFEQLSGTAWSLIKFQSEDKYSKINYPLGEDATGYIIFTKENIMAVQIMAKDRTQTVSKEIIDSMNTRVEAEMAENGCHAYSGTFTLDEEQAILTTKVEMSLVPAYIGSEQKRSVKIEGDRLYLSNIAHPERQLVWQRVK